MNLDSRTLQAFELGYGHSHIKGGDSCPVDAVQAWGVVCAWEGCEIGVVGIPTSDDAVAWVCLRSGHAEAVQFISLKPDAFSGAVNH